MTYDVIVIGCGPGGEAAVVEAAEQGLRVALVEARELGGTCLNRGCIPTKTLIHTADVVRELKNGKIHGLSAEPKVDYPALKARKEEVVEGLRKGIEAEIKAGKIDLYVGEASLRDAHTVVVNEEELEAPSVILATGSVPAIPPIPGSDLPGVVTSDDILEQVRPYQQLVIIGGGVIGVEIAGVYEALGTQVTIIEALDRLLPGLEVELGRSLATVLKKRGVAVHCAAKVSAIEEADGALCVRFEEKGTEQVVRAEGVLIATGRRANTSLVGDLPVEMHRGRVLTDSCGRTSIPGLYAIGDIADGYPQLAHTAAAMGVNAVCAITKQTPKRNMSLIPSIVYTSPEIGSIGLTEAEAVEHGKEVVVGKANTFSNARSVIAESERGFVKIVAEKTSGKLLGAVFMCERATDLIHEMEIVIAAGMTVSDLLMNIQGHPTFSEVIVRALEAALKKLAQ